MSSGPVISFLGGWRAIFFAFGLLLLGLALAHGVSIFSDLERIQGDLGDTRFNATILEHYFQYARGHQQELWHTPWSFSFYPRTLFLSDAMFSNILLYFPIRVFMNDGLQAFEVWLIFVSVLNFLTFYILLRYLSASAFAAAIGSYVFAFSLPMFGWLNHPQVQVRYFLVVSVLAMVLATRGQGAARLWWAVLAGVSFAAQFWSSFYLAWFFGLLGILSAILLPYFYREKMSHWLKSYGLIYAVAGLTALLLMAPLARNYLLVVKELGQARDWWDVSFFLPRWQTVLYAPAESFWYPWLHKLHTPRMGQASGEKYMFMGFITMILVVIGGKKEKAGARFLLALTLFAALLCIRWGKQPWQSGWYLVYQFVPGGSAIRAVGRFTMVILIPFSILVAWGIDRLRDKGGRAVILAYVLGFAAVVENFGYATYSFGFSEHRGDVDGIKQQLQEKAPCDLFHSARPSAGFYIAQISAMWASLESGIPTTNGYSGSVPPHYKEAGMEPYDHVTEENIRKWLDFFPPEKQISQICILK